MATFAFSKSTNQIQINSYVDEQPGEYDFAVDALNNILVITAKSGGYRAEIHTLKDTITISGSGFSGTAAQLKTQLLSDIFTSGNTNSGGGLVLESYQNSAMSAAVMAYVYRDESNNIYGVYEPIRNNKVYRKSFAYADSIDKFPFDSVNYFNNTLNDVKLIGIASDAIINSSDLTEMVINGNAHTGLQIINNVIKGDYGDADRYPHLAELYITGINVIIEDINMTYGSYLDSLGDNCHVSTATIAAYCSIDFLGKTGCIINTCTFETYSGMEFDDNDGKIYTSVIREYAYADIRNGSQANSIDVGMTAYINIVNNVNDTEIGFAAQVDSTSGAISSKRFANFGGVTYELGVTAGTGILKNVIIHH
jgi:hypothetical protein